MEEKNGDSQQRPFRAQTVRGEPYQVGGRTLVPVARVVSFARARGTIGNPQVGGWLGVWVSVIPVALMEQTPDGERAIPLVDTTAAALRAMAAAAAGVTLGLALIRWAARRARR